LSCSTTTPLTDAVKDSESVPAEKLPLPPTSPATSVPPRLDPFSVKVSVLVIVCGPVVPASEMTCSSPIAATFARGLGAPRSALIAELFDTTLSSTPEPGARVTPAKPNASGLVPSDCSAPVFDAKLKPWIAVAPVSSVLAVALVTTPLDVDAAL